jgi:hypothetical protein
VGNEYEPVEQYWRPAFAVMLEESRQSVGNQLTELDGLRSRAANTIGFAGVVAGIAFANSGDVSHFLAGAVGVAAVLAACLAGYVLFPVRMVVNMSASRIGTLIRDSGTPSAAMETLALYYEANYGANLHALQRRHTAQFLALMALGLEVLFVVLLFV